MNTNITRRNFLKTTATLGAAAVFSKCAMSSFAAEQAAALAIIEGGDYVKSTAAAIEQLGGMSQFVSKDTIVGLLINSPFQSRGTYVNPDIALTVARLCAEAGAKEVRCLKGESPSGYWRRTPFAKEHVGSLAVLTSGSGSYVKQAVAGVAVKEVEINEQLLACDILISMSVAKHHMGTNFSCILKNMMGATSDKTNQFFHFGAGGTGWYDNVDFLSQCIADLNLVRTPDLCIADATEFITTNGPFGPGKLAKPQQVVAGRNRVLVDSYCCTLLGLEAKNVVMIAKASEHGLGSMDINAAVVKKLAI